MGDVLQWSLTKVLSKSDRRVSITRSEHRELTTSIRTAKSLLFSNQNAQLASHLFPSLNASGTTVSLRISCNTGPSSSPSTILAKAIASCTSPICLKQILTASLNAPPSKKNAAAYPKRWAAVRETDDDTLCRPQTPSLFAQQSVGIFQCSRPPSWLREIVREELQHNLLFLVPRRLPPQPVHKLYLAQREVKQTAIGWIPLVFVHILVPSNGFQMCFLHWPVN